MDSIRPYLKRLSTFEPNDSPELKSISLTGTENFLAAIGYKNGEIGLFDININNSKFNLLNKFQSHRKGVNALHFSSTPGAPIILVSLSAEICFWDVTYALNNPMERTRQRHSQRFTRKLNAAKVQSNQNGKSPFGIRNDNRNIETNGNECKINQAVVDQQLNELSLNVQRNSISNCFNGNVRMEAEAESRSESGLCTSRNPWIGKCGTIHKPELLSCIKFVGSSAEKIFINKTFTAFITIDNEGEVYYLRTLDLNNENHS